MASGWARSTLQVVIGCFAIKMLMMLFMSVFGQQVSDAAHMSPPICEKRMVAPLPKSLRCVELAWLSQFAFAFYCDRLPFQCVAAFEHARR